MIKVFLIGVFVLGSAALVVGVAVGVVRRLQGHPDEPWEDGPKPGQTRIRPGAGWGNGGSWN